MNLKEKILKLWDKDKFTKADRNIFKDFIHELNEGKIRAAEKIKGNGL